MADKPQTVRELQKQKEQEAAKTRATLTIQNISKQRIPIHTRPPQGVDFYMGAQDVQLDPGNTYTFPKHRLWDTQIDRLCKRKMISIISDTSKNMA